MPDYDYNIITRYKERRKAVKKTCYKIEKARRIILPHYGYEYTLKYPNLTTVTRDKDQQLLIWINVDPNWTGSPYFKVYNSAMPEDGVSKVARLHFKDEGMEYHNDKYRDWTLTEDDIKRIKELLMEPGFMFSEQYTNWQMACYQWNYENDFIDLPDEYFKGEDDEKNKANPLYILHDQKMPETWIYNPPKGKGKRK